MQEANKHKFAYSLTIIIGSFNVIYAIINGYVSQLPATRDALKPPTSTETCRRLQWCSEIPTWMMMVMEAPRVVIPFTSLLHVFSLCICHNLQIHGTMYTSVNLSLIHI